MTHSSPSSPRPSWDETWLMVASSVACRSLCARDRVGAVIVDYRNRIVATGFNGPPSGFDHGERQCTDWCARAIRSSDARSVLEAGMPDQRVPLTSDYSDCPSLHAEANALMVCDRAVREGGTIYVTSHICFTCAKLVANSGLTLAVVRPQAEHAHRNAAASYEFLERCGVAVEVLDVL